MIANTSHLIKGQVIEVRPKYNGDVRRVLLRDNNLLTFELDSASVSAPM